MIARSWSLWRCLALTLAMWMVLSGSASAAIEAVKGKRYKLAPNHGPWMIMVTSLSGETKEQEERATKAADELVFQLRKKGIPAYVYSTEDKYEEVHGIDRMGRPKKRKYVAQHGMIGIVAGNYPSLEDKAAQQTLKFIKRFEPKVSVEGKDRKVQEFPLPLNKAYLVRNPLLPAEQLARKVKDPLLLQLNNGMENSLFENKGKYSLIVASFYGNSQIKPVEFAKFDKQLKNNTNISLENAGRESWQLCKAMRSQGIEAYVYHEKFRSIVTVGSFKTKDDPEIERKIKMFEAKYKRDESTGKDVLVAESIQISGMRKGDAPSLAWTMDPQPKLIEVPRR
ncbi:MAG: hypothetical protein ACKV0T_14100 [Planctomycetales bacterium]